MQEPSSTETGSEAALPKAAPTIKTHRRACHLCEAICGLVIQTDGEQILSIKGDPDDPLSRGYLCPKAVALQDIHQDPERLRLPLLRTDAGWREISWPEAIELAAHKLAGLQAAHGDDAVAVYAGNPAIHSIGTWLYSGLVTRALASRNRYSATSVDQLPHHLVSLLMYGHWLRIPVVDMDRCDWLLILGANPLASNGSLMTAPDMPGRLKALRARGGLLTVVDPRYTETAQLADDYLTMVPGQDVYLLLAMLNHLFASQQVNPGAFAGRVAGLESLAALLAPFTPQLAEQRTGIAADKVRALADGLARSPRAAVYGRMGVSTQEHGSLCQWAIQLLNLLTGHLDVEGGLMLSDPAIDSAAPGTNPQAFDRYRSRVRGLPEFAGEFPVATLADEIRTPGDGQIRGLLTIAGNPVLSTPNGRQLDAALGELEFMVAVDFYLNETTRHAHLILPPVSPLEREHYDIVFHAFGVHNMARYNDALFAKPEGSLHDWEIFAALGAALCARKQLPVREALPPEQRVDALLRAGARPLSVAQLREHPSGLDLGPHRPRMAALYSAEQPVQLLPPAMADALAQLPLTAPAPDAGLPALRLIGRRHTRSNNSWMHRYHRLIKGKRRDALWVNPEDLAALGLADGQPVQVRSRVGQVLAVARAEASMSRGVVSLPHGFGQRPLPGQQLPDGIQGSVSANDLTDDRLLDGISGNAALNGVRVSVRAVDGARPAKAGARTALA